MGETSMNTIYRYALRTSDFFENITKWPLIIIGGLMLGVVLVGTFWRYVLNSPILWTEEAARYLMIWMALNAASISMKRREHVSMRLFVNRLPFKAQIVLNFLTNSIMLYFLYILTKEGLIMALNARSQVSPALGISMFWPVFSVPLSGFLMIVQLILVMVMDICNAYFERGNEVHR